MRLCRRILCLLAAALLTLVCLTPDSSGVNAQEAESQEEGYPTCYEIFVYSFCDSDGDGIGDLNGITSRLDYLQDLGVGGIWLTPIHPAETYHKYDVADYYDIDPQFGTLEDFDNLIAECDKRGIKVILDLVLNHTSTSHPWFQAAKTYLEGLEPGEEPDAEECPYVDYYFFNQEKKNSTYYALEGENWYYEGKFWSEMPDLNLENEALREEIRDIMAFWFDRGVDGFRLDAVKEYFSGQTSRNVEVLRFITETARELNPDAYLVAEVWENFQTIADYYESGVDSIFNFPFADSSGKIVSVIRGMDKEKTVSSFATAQEKAYAAYAEANPDFIDAPFLSNHDTGRIAGFCARNEDKIKLAAAMNLLMSGTAFVYYGEELGMTGSGSDPNKRAPMLWNLDGTDGVTDPPPECEVPDEYVFGSLQEQVDDPESIYNYYREAIALRNALPVISRGVPTAETALNTGLVSATRKTFGDQTAIILINFAAEATVCDLSAYPGYTLAGQLNVGTEQASMENGNLTIPAYGVAVITG